MINEMKGSISLRTRAKLWIRSKSFKIRCMQNSNPQDQPIRVLWNAHLDHDSYDFPPLQTLITPQTAP
jgi:hypothetical protein